MSAAGARQIPLVFVDTNVFYPVRLADLVLSCVGDGLFDLCVSDPLLDEIERVLITDKGLMAEKSAAFRAALLASASTNVTKGDCEVVRDQLDGPDPDDLWHLGAAIHAQADFILTSNTSDFENAKIPESVLRISITKPDDFFTQLIIDGLGDDLTTTISRMSARLKRPHRTPSEIVDGLEQIGLAITAEHLRNV